MSGKPALATSVVANASPFLTLSKAGLEQVLPGLFTRVVVPGSVWEEISAYRDLSWRKFLAAQWVRREDVPVDPRILVWNLGKGESEALSWALQHSDCMAVVDDLAARKCAKALNILHMGTVGTLVLARRFGLLSSLESALTRVRRAGLYLKDDLVSRLLEEDSS